MSISIWDPLNATAWPLVLLLLLLLNALFLHARDGRARICILTEGYRVAGPVQAGSQQLYKSVTGAVRVLR